MYCILWEDGRTLDGFKTLAAAEYAIRRSKPVAKIGHPGDLADGGDHTLAWRDATAAAQGKPAIAMILYVPLPSAGEGEK